MTPDGLDERFLELIGRVFGPQEVEEYRRGAQEARAEPERVREVKGHSMLKLPGPMHTEICTMAPDPSADVCGHVVLFRTARKGGRRFYSFRRDGRVEVTPPLALGLLEQLDPAPGKAHETVAWERAADSVVEQVRRFFEDTRALCERVLG